MYKFSKLVSNDEKLRTNCWISLTPVEGEGDLARLSRAIGEEGVGGDRPLATCALLAPKAVLVEQRRHLQSAQVHVISCRISCHLNNLISFPK